MRVRDSIGTLSVATREGLLYLVSIIALAAVYFPAHSFVPTCFDDCLGYIPLMGVPLFSPRYWLVAQTMFRGFSVPIIYSFFGELHQHSAYAVIVFQALVGFLSWIAFAIAVAGLVSGRRTRWLLFMLIASAMFSRGYLAFDDRFLSDSLALSLMLLWLAIVVNPFPLLDFARRRLGRAGLVAFLVLFAVATAMAASARDANVLLLVCCIPLVVLRLWKRELPTSIAVSMIAIIVLIGAMQWRSAAERNGLNMADIIGGVVLPDAERKAFFVARGMPESIASITTPRALAGRTLGQIIDDRQLVIEQIGLLKYVIMRLDPGFARHHARSIWASYLSRHPKYVLGNIAESWAVMFDQWYDGRPSLAAGVSIFEVSKLLWIADWIDVRFLIVISIVLLLATLATVRAGRSDLLLQLGVILALGGSANAVISFHGDCWEVAEMARHAWIGSTFLRLGAAVICFRAVSLLADSIHLLGFARADT
ncbi:MAG TPA: hypothetical protein VJ901_00080 [Thermoanaerobaculia bacterium]|nr:hypothetical protein [Thermoanaerobaculia bacterium]